MAQQKSTSVLVGDGYPISYYQNAFVRACLDDLRDPYGPSASGIVRAAVASLYRSVIGDGETGHRSQYEALCERCSWNSQQCIEYALFWLWQSTRLLAERGTESR
jgi:hypothetical protein